MPKVKTCKAVYAGVMFEANLNVNSDGEFSVARPGTQEDWPDHTMKICGTIAEEVEKEWLRAVIAIGTKSKTERKVLAVKFNSLLRKGGEKDVFVGRDVMLFLECAVGLETTLTRGGEVFKSYREHPDYCGFGADQPFPAMMRLEFNRRGFVVVEWSQEAEDLLVRACEGVQAVVDLLDEVLSTPDAIQRASHATLSFHPQNNQLIIN